MTYSNIFRRIVWDYLEIGLSIQSDTFDHFQIIHRLITFTKEINPNIAL